MLIALKVEDQIVCKFLPCTSTRIVPTVINANTISLSYSNDSTNVASTTTIEVPVTIDLK